MKKGSCDVTDTHRKKSKNLGLPVPALLCSRFRTLSSGTPPVLATTKRLGVGFVQSYTKKKISASS